MKHLCLGPGIARDSCRDQCLGEYRLRGPSVIAEFLKSLRISRADDFDGRKRAVDFG